MFRIAKQNFIVLKSNVAMQMAATEYSFVKLQTYLYTHF